MSKIDIILPRLAGVRKAPARAGVVQAYRACCPAHQPEGPKSGRSPSLSVAEAENGAVLLHCFAGCSVDEITGAVGVELTELFPDSSSGGGSGIPGGPAGWAGAAALLDSAYDAAANAAAGGDWQLAMVAIDAARKMARQAMRKGVPA